MNATYIRRRREWWVTQKTMLSSRREMSEVTWPLYKPNTHLVRQRGRSEGAWTPSATSRSLSKGNVTGTGPRFSYPYPQCGFFASNGVHTGPKWAIFSIYICMCITYNLSALVCIHSCCPCPRLHSSALVFMYLRLWDALPGAEIQIRNFRHRPRCSSCHVTEFPLSSTTFGVLMSLEETRSHLNIRLCEDRRNR